MSLLPNPLRRTHLATLLALLALAGCSSVPDGSALPGAATTPAVRAGAPARPTSRADHAAAPQAKASSDLEAPPPVRFEVAVDRAGRNLFAQARGQLGNESRVVVVDPLIDANTGAQTISTVEMGQQLESIAMSKSPAWSVEPLTRRALAEKPLLLIGTLTPVTVERSIDARPDAFRVWLTLIDLRTGRIVAKQLDRSTVDSVNPEPLPYYRDSPTWHKDSTVLGYIDSCQVGTNIGDPADPAYLARLPAAAVVNEAILAYDDGKIPLANKLYREAEPLAERGDLRVLNGLYLTSWQLGQHEEAREVFGKLVESGLELKRLPLKILFQPGKTTFNPIGDLPQQYRIWLGSLAQGVDKLDSCVRVVGHTSRTGSARNNEILSRRRAETVERMLEHDNRRLGTKLSATGVGSREALVGLGTDDQRDALDRRVEFRVVDCV